MSKKLSEVQKVQNWITEVVTSNRLETSKNHCSQRSFMVNGNKKTFVIEKRAVALNTRTRHLFTGSQYYLSVVKRVPQTPNLGFEQLHSTMIYRFSSKITEDSIKTMSEFLLSK